MSLGLGVAVDDAPAERAPGDLLLVGAFADDRPLRGAAGRVDWRECGLLTEQIRGGLDAGAASARLLIPSSGRFAAGRALLFGLGPRAGFAEPELAEAVRSATRSALALRAGRVALALPAEGHSGIAAPEAALIALAAVSEVVAAEPFPLHLRLVVEPGTAYPVRLALEQRGAASVPPGIEVRLDAEGSEAAPGFVPKPGRTASDPAGSRPRVGSSSLP